jgi:hypothetical protein
LAGFFVCSMFLSLQGYEVLYYLLLLANATLLCSGRLGVEQAQRAPQALGRGSLAPRMTIRRS